MNKKNNSPEMDYYELRRRREEYKRARMQGSEPAEAVEEIEAVYEDAAPVKKSFFAKKNTEPAPVAAEEAAAPEPAPAEDEEMSFEDRILAQENRIHTEAGQGGDSEDDFGPVVNPSPFDPFMRAVKGIVGKKKKNKADEFDEDDFTDEELEMAGLIYDEETGEYREYDEFADLEIDVPAEAYSAAPATPDIFDEEEIDDAPSAPVADIAEDIGFEPVKRTGKRHNAVDESDFDNEYAEDFEDDFTDEDFEALEEEFNGAKKPGGFKKFLNLFVTRIDEDEYEDEPEDDFEDDFSEEYEEEFYAELHRMDAPEPAEPANAAEGGANMDELNQPAVQPAVDMAKGLEESGMSRRERRELAMRLAAEEAARKEAENAQVETAVAVVEEEKVDMAAFKSVTNDSIIESTAEDVSETQTANEVSAEEGVEEPTREFTPVAVRSSQSEAAESLFDLENDEEFDEDDEEEEKARWGLFGRKRARKYAEEEDDDFDEDDEDDEEPDYDDLDDEDEDEKPRRGLFGRKKRREVIEEDDEDDEDDEDYDDEDEYDDFDDEEYDEDDEYDDLDDEDEYDEYDDEDEDDYDDDDDGSRRSFGHHLLGFLKVLAGVAAVLVVIVLTLNFLYISGNAGLVDTLHDKMGDNNAVFDLLFPCHAVRAELPVEETLPDPTIEPIAVAPTKAPVVAAPTENVISIPNLDENTTTQVQATDAPVPTATPEPVATQLPASVG